MSKLYKYLLSLLSYMLEEMAKLLCYVNLPNEDFLLTLKINIRNLGIY